MSNARLEDCSLFLCRDGEVRLTGLVYGHPRFDDGASIHTSRTMWINDQECATRNTGYELLSVATGDRPLRRAERKLIDGGATRLAWAQRLLDR
jgi:hypothetical protein